MDAQYYDDPIEHFDSDENVIYYGQEEVYGFQGQQITDGVNDAYDDDLELEYSEYMRLIYSVFCPVILVLSSPSPMRALEPSRNMHHARPYYGPNASYRRQEVPQGMQENWDNSLSKLMLCHCSIARTVIAHLSCFCLMEFEVILEHFRDLITTTNDQMNERSELSVTTTIEIQGVVK
jgi:hypothetical protein